MLLAITFFILLGCLTSWALIQLLLESGLGQKSAAGSAQHHHTHTGVIPRIGGIGLVAPLLITYALCFGLLDDRDNQTLIHFGIVSGGFMAFMIGVIDDFHPLGAKVKLLAQIAIGIYLHQTGVSIERFTIPFSNTSVDLPFVLSVSATVFWIVAMMNLINLIDGLDGLAGGIGLMMMLLLAYLGYEAVVPFSMILALGMAGALLGFLFHNFPPAKVYMGDSGAYLIGYMIAALSLINSEKGTVIAALIAPVLALALPIADVSFAILRRGLKGLPLFRPDQKHIHHRLLGSGLSRRNTVMVLYGISLFALLGGLLVFANQGRYLPIFMGFSFVMVLIALRGPKLMQSATMVRNMFTDSLTFRQDTRNAIYLRDWLVIEAERADSGENLWSDYRFVLRKMGFCKAVFMIDDDERSFQIEDCGDCSLDTCMEHRQVIRGRVSAELRLFAARDHITVGQFEVLADLAVEAWVKTASRWQELYDEPLTFKSDAKKANRYRESRGRALYRPTY